MHPARYRALAPILRTAAFSSARQQRYSSTSAKPLELAFELASKSSESSSAKTAPPIVILHGLFGQKQNWRSLSKAMAQSMNTNVYTVDLRNHGTSPHHEDMRISTMASDVMHFFEQHDLSNVALIGHSMGGKIASALALNPSLPPSTLSSLVVADMTPLKFSMSSEFEYYARAMKEVEKQNVKSGKEAMKILQEWDIDLPIQQFLLTNLGGVVNGGKKFRIPLNILHSGLPHIGDFPYEPGEAQYDGPTLFIRGGKSHYVADSRLPKIRQFFPRMELETLDAGHWLHAERPQEFLDAVKRFILKSSP